MPEKIIVKNVTPDVAREVMVINTHATKWVHIII